MVDFSQEIARLTLASIGRNIGTQWVPICGIAPETAGVVHSKLVPFSTSRAVPRVAIHIFRHCDCIVYMVFLRIFANFRDTGHRREIADSFFGAASPFSFVR